MGRLSSVRRVLTLSATATTLALLAALMVAVGVGAPAGVAEARLASETPGSDPTAAPDPTATTEAAGTGIRLVQANIRSGMSASATASDIGQVYAQQPDFITFNEVSSRSDAQLAPAGYAIQRTPGTYTGPTPVVWNTSRWTKLAGGTYQISDRWGKTKKQKIHWGVRYANWVTVRDVAGRTLSVVSTHFAPSSKYTKGLAVPSYQRLGALARTLSVHGPVLMAGDVNVNYRGAYPRAEIAALGLVNVFDLAGVAPATHRSGAVIDHVYMYGAEELLPVTNLTTVNVHSDHKLLVADFGNVGVRAGAFSPRWVGSNASDPKAVMRLIKEAINMAPPGSALHLATKKLGGKGIVRTIRNARARGVEVQIITGHRKTKSVDKDLKQLLGSRKKHKSWAKRRANWGATGLPKAIILASSSGGTRAVRIDYNRPWVPKQVKRAGASAQVRADQVGYDDMFVKYFAAVGRKIG